MLAVMTMIMTMILTMVMIMMIRRVLFHKPAPHRASRWGWKDPLCPAQNRSQSPEKDQLCHHHDSEDSPEVIFGDIFRTCGSVDRRSFPSSPYPPAYPWFLTTNKLDTSPTFMEHQHRYHI